ncbi:MAG: M48 family metallopeptidase [Bacteriovoracaceae bacterium]|nr:M48 family metallopeptidase [Bacteriovoracaceae bacterium]
MKYVPKLSDENFNVSKVNPYIDLLKSCAIIISSLIFLYVASGLCIDLTVDYLPNSVEQKIVDLYVKLKDQKKAPTTKTSDEIKLQSILDNLIAHSKLSQLSKNKYVVSLVKHKKMNAFATFGRTILIHDEVIKQAKSENEIAFVLAHELGHFASNDHLRGMGRGLFLVVIAVTLFGTNSAVNEFLTSLTGSANLSYSRKSEINADNFGLTLLNETYGHVAGARDFFEKLSNEETKIQMLFRYSSTHPYSKKRIDNIVEVSSKKGYMLTGELLPYKL